MHYINPLKQKKEVQKLLKGKKRQKERRSRKTFFFFCYVIFLFKNENGSCARHLIKLLKNMGRTVGEAQAGSLTSLGRSLSQSGTSGRVTGAAVLLVPTSRRREWRGPCIGHSPFLLSAHMSQPGDRMGELTDYFFITRKQTNKQTHTYKTVSLCSTLQNVKDAVYTLI